MKKRQIIILSLLGIMFVFKGYTIVIGQTKPVPAALSKADATLTIIDPVTSLNPAETTGKPANRPRESRPISKKTFVFDRTRHRSPRSAVGAR